MADVTKIQSLRNKEIAWTKTAGAASQTVVYDRSDENIVLLFENGGGADCSVNLIANGNMAGDVGDYEVEISDGEFAIVGAVESARFVAPSTNKLTFTITDQDGTAYSGTVGSVKVTALALPKSLVD